MPFPSNAELPDSVKSGLPDGAQDIYRSAFNRAWREYDEGEGQARRNEAARRIAWAAVLRRYERVGDSWHLRH
ncbi:ChaB family protein [Azospirillum halopraeferens]|uniref:ChaB family protein n=1 Tax=Azospirillum halopraeferens TaxID=34010 RepID=UPI000407776E|nr:ChaB family protein [Azospirillum halopraeferens]